MPSLTIRIYFEDTDAQGLVYNSNYLKYLERGRTEFLRNMGYDQKELLKNGIIFVVKKVNLDFIKAAELDDIIEIKSKILEVKKDEQKVRVGLKQLGIDPFDFFKNKKVNDVLTVQVISSDNKGLIVKPENCELNFIIKKSNIAVNSADARPSRFVGGERIDTAISELNIEKRKVSLSIKLLEELQNKEAVSKFSSPLSGKNLPFSSLSEKLDDKKKKGEE